MPDCALCSPSELTVADTGAWSIRVNADQALLGRSYFVLNRHETDVTSLSADELTSLWALFSKVKAALDTLFQPDHYNYVFLMNVSAHLHAHIIPRYRTIRQFDGEAFTDNCFGDNFDTSHPHVPSMSALLTLRDAIAAEVNL